MDLANNKKLYIYIILSLIIVHFLLLMGVIFQNSPTCDEISHHIASGYSYIMTQDFRMNPANPPLVRMISASFLLFLHPVLPLDHISWQTADPSVFGNEFFHVANTNPRLMTICARIPIALLSLLLALLVWYWSFRLYGKKGALVSLVFYCFCPTILAHGALATSDLGACFFGVLSLFMFWLLWQRKYRTPLQSFILILLAGLCFGLVQASKFTYLLLLPIFVIITLVTYFSDKRKGVYFDSLLKRFFLIAGIVVIGYAVVFCVYFFEYKPFLKNVRVVAEKIEMIDTIISHSSISLVNESKEKILHFLTSRSMPFSSYILGLIGIIRQGMIGHPSFLLGQRSQTGFWNYFLIAFLVKTTIASLIMFCICLALFISRLNTKRREELFLLVPMLIFFLCASKGKVQIGIRHIILLYPLLCIFFGKIMALDVQDTLLRKKTKIVYAIVGILFALHCISSLSVYPYSLAYFNELLGGQKNGHEVLLDSNLDWGQGLIALEKYMQREKLESIRLFYFGSADLSYYNIPYKWVQPKEYKTPYRALYAISGKYLTTFEWTQGLTPDAIVGGSIYIYDLRKARAKDRNKG